MSSSITKAFYVGRHDVLILQDPADSSQFHVGYWGISPTSSDWQKQKPSADYYHAILAFCIDESHSTIHSLHDDGAVRFFQRWNVLTGDVTRLDTDLPSASFKAMLYSADLSRYIVARDNAAVHVIDPLDGTTVTLITGISTSACCGVLVTGQQIGVVSPGSIYYSDLYTGQITGPYGGSATDTSVGALGGIVSAHQNTFTGAVTVVGPSSGNPLFRQFKASCVADIRDINANGTSGLSGLPNTNPNANKYGAPEPNFQQSQIIGSQAFPASWSEGQFNCVCQSLNPALSAVEMAAGIQSNVTDWARDWTTRAPGSWSLKALEGNSSLAAAAWAATLDEPALDTERWGGAMDPSYFSLASFEAVHSWCVSALAPSRTRLTLEVAITRTPRQVRVWQSVLNLISCSTRRFRSRHSWEAMCSWRAVATSTRQVACSAWASRSRDFCQQSTCRIETWGTEVSTACTRRHSTASIKFASTTATFWTNIALRRSRLRTRTASASWSRVQLATISAEGCGRDQSAELLAKSVLDNGTAGRRNASFKIDYLGYALSPTDGITVSNQQCGLSALPMRLASIRETDSGGKEEIELSAVEFKNTIDALYLDVNQTSQPGVITVGSGYDQNCTNAIAPYVDGVGINTQGLNYFNQGAALPAGTYTVAYLQGSYTNSISGTHYFADGYNICVRSQSTGHVVKLASTPTRPDPTSSFPDGRPGYYTYQDCFAVNSQVPPISITLVEPGAVFLQASGSLDPHVAPDTPNLTFQLCFPIEAGAPDISTVSGIQLWVSADDGAYHDLGATLAINNQSVEQWNDQSGNGRNAIQTTSGNRPTLKTNQINGYPAIQFVAANSTSMDCGAFIPDSPTFAIFAVYKINSTSNANVVYSASSTTSHISPYLRDGDPGAGGSGFTSAASTYNEVADPGAPASTWVTAQLYLDGTNLVSVLNGTQTASVACAVTPETLTGHGTIGAITGYEYMDGMIAELIVVSPCPSPTDRATIESALNAKFSIY